jgi:hypothetical protein
MPKGYPPYKKRPPERREYNTDEEYEQAIVHWMYENKNLNHRPTPEEPQEPAMKYYLQDIDSSKEIGSVREQDKKPTPEEPEHSDHPDDGSNEHKDSSKQIGSGQAQNKKPSPASASESSRGGSGADTGVKPDDEATKKELEKEIQDKVIISLYAEVSQHGLSYTAFLGGISITLMVLVLSSPPGTFDIPGTLDIPFLDSIGFGYSQFLALWAAITGFLLILASVGFLVFSALYGMAKDVSSTSEYNKLAKLTKKVSTSTEEENHGFMYAVIFCLAIAFLGLIIFLPLLLVPFFWIGAIILAILEFLVFRFLWKSLTS